MVTINPSISVFTSNTNGLNMPIKRVLEWIFLTICIKNVYLKYKMLNMMPGIWCPQKGAGGGSCN